MAGVGGRVLRATGEGTGLRAAGVGAGFRGVVGTLWFVLIGYGGWGAFAFVGFALCFLLLAVVLFAL